MLLRIDGHAHYDTAQLARKWQVTSDFCTWAIANEGRWSSNPCIKRTSTGNNITTGYIACAPFMQQTGLWTPTGSGVCGFAFKTQALARHVGGNPGALGNNGYLIGWYEGSQIHCCAQLNPDGTISIYAQPIAGSMNLLGTSPSVLSDNTWTFLEFKWVIGNTGSVRVRANGIEVLACTGDTLTDYGGATLLGVWTSVRLLAMQSSLAPYLTCWLNDFYLCDLLGSGDQRRDFLGDVRIQTILPNGAGAAAGWTPSAGANWAAVDETPGDDDTTYVSTSAAGTRDGHAYQDIPTTAVVLGFQTCHLAKRQSAGSATLKPTVRSGGTTHDGHAQAVSSDTQYTYAVQPYDTNPVTGAQATAAEINAAEFGTLYV